MNFARIAEKVFLGGVNDQLKSLLPNDFYKVVSDLDSSSQVEFLKLLEQNGKKTFKIVIKHGGDPARKGFEEGYLLSVNERIKPLDRDDPSGSEVVERPKTHRIKYNTIELAKFKHYWIPLD
jgi:hypothetical protein